MHEGDDVASRTVETARQRIERFFRNEAGVFSLEEDPRGALLAGNKPIGTFRVLAGSLADMASVLGIANSSAGDIPAVNRALDRKMPGFSVGNESAFVPTGTSGEEVWTETLHIRYHAAKDPWQWPVHRRLVWFASRRTGMTLQRTRSAAIWLSFLLFFGALLFLICIVRPSGWRYLLQIFGRLVRAASTQ
jgi:hypothetical protein